MKINEIKVKDLTFLVYSELSEQELEIKQGTKIQEANSPIGTEYTFLRWTADKFGVIAVCESHNGRMRYFLKDAIKKSATQIKHETKIKRQKLKAEKEKLKKQKLFERERKRKEKETLLQQKKESKILKEKKKQQLLKKKKKIVKKY